VFGILVLDLTELALELELSKELIDYSVQLGPLFRKFILAPRAHAIVLLVDATLAEHQFTVLIIRAFALYRVPRDHLAVAALEVIVDTFTRANTVLGVWLQHI